MNLQTNKGILDAADQVIDTIQQDKEIQKILAATGFTQKRVEEGIALREHTLTMQDAKEKHYDERWEIARQLNQDTEAAIKLFRMHVQIARIAFRDKPYLIRTLKIQRFAKKRWDLIRQAEQFYSYLVHTGTDMKAYGIGQAALEQAEASIAAVVSNKYERTRKKGAAENSTQEKQKAYAALKNWLTEFRHIARFAFRDTPQRLESFGIMVPSGVK